MSAKKYKKYEGSWVDGKMHGHGTMYWKNGDSWTGLFVDNDLQGKGIYTSPKAETQGRYFQHSRHVAWFNGRVTDVALCMTCMIILFTCGSRSRLGTPH